MVRGQFLLSGKGGKSESNRAKTTGGLRIDSSSLNNSQYPKSYYFESDLPSLASHSSRLRLD
jgi:hypothetical protein